MRRNSMRIGVGALVLSALLGSALLAQDGRWQPYTELETRGGSQRWLGRASVVAPLRQDSRNLLFADVRGLFTDRGEEEGNFGLAFRTVLDVDRIFGAYAFYDFRQSQIDNQYHQMTLGAELLDVDWGLRGNVYLPELGTQSAAGASVAYLQGNAIFLRQGLEAAYWGVDLEAERRLWFSDMGNLDAEWWAAAGVFHFDNPNNGFESLTGPRMRTEMRLLDLPLLGNDSRLVLGGQYEYDELRGSVGSGYLNVRIPLGPGGARRRRLRGLQRRMQAPIVRDTDIVTNSGTFGAPEPVKNTRTGAAISNVVVVTADDFLPAEIAAAGADSVVILDGSEGDFIGAVASVLSNGQVVMGGGTRLSVTGCNSGARAEFLAPGETPFVTGFYSELQIDNPVFEMADNSTIQGVGVYDSFIGIETGDSQNILVYDNGLFGNVVGLHGGRISGDVRDNYIDGNSVAGIQLLGLTGGAIADNWVAYNGQSGIVLEELDGGSITGNEAEFNGENGIEARFVTSGSISGNRANDNGVDGYLINEIHGGIVSGNSAARNGEYGYHIDLLDGGRLEGNLAESNESHGFRIYGIEGGVVTGNRAMGNAESGFYTVDFVDGELSGNLAEGNEGSGFEIETVTSRLFGNSAIGNGANGFAIENIRAGGRVERNSAFVNAGHGLDINYLYGGIVAGNSAESNGVHGFEIADVQDNAVVADNTASDNGASGFRIFGFSESEMRGNLAEHNAVDGISISTLDGFLFDNHAIGNGRDGFHIPFVESRGELHRNSAIGNGRDGFAFTGFDGGLAQNNLASENERFGFELNDFLDGEISRNAAEKNGEDGFWIESLDRGLFARNYATRNGDDGFDLSELLHGTVFENISEHNDDDGFDFEDISGGLISANQALRNREAGYELYFLGGNSSEFSGNSATQNGELGYQIDGTPSVGVGTNVGSANAGGNSY